MRFTRADFLRFDVDSIRSPGNDTMFERLRSHALDQDSFVGSDEKNIAENIAGLLDVEDWQSWEHYPKLEQLSLEDDDKAVTLMAWLLDTFGWSVCVASSSAKRREEDGSDLDSVLQKVSLDDMAFIFVQVEHNISKWLMICKAVEEQRIEAWKDLNLGDGGLDKIAIEPTMSGDDKKRLALINEWGSEFPAGSGVAGKDGKRRYNAITKLFHSAYYKKDCNIVKRNREKLFERLKQLNKERRQSDGDEGGSSLGSSGKKGNSKQVEQAKDPEMEAIHAEAWDDVEDGVVVPV